MTDEPIFTHALREPIKDIKGDPVAVISFRKPTAGDIIRCGNPVKFQPHDDDREITFDEVKTGRMISALSGIPLPMIERMDPNDFADCMWGIAGFFLPGMKRPAAT